MSVKKTLDEFRNYLEIDKDGLDEAIERQAALYFKVAEHGAYAQSRRDQAKADMDSMFATACDKARTRAAKSDTKITEAMVKESAETSELYKQAVRDYLEAKTDAELLQALERSFDQRGKMLRELAQLFISGYFQVSGVSAAANSTKDHRANMNRQRMQLSRDAEKSSRV